MEVAEIKRLADLVKSCRDLRIWLRICGFAALGHQKSMMTRGRLDLPHLGHEKRGWPKLWLTKAGHLKQATGQVCVRSVTRRAVTDMGASFRRRLSRLDKERQDSLGLHNTAEIR